MMLTEKDLLLDIIQNTPESSIWEISSDSWERIPEVFSEFITITNRNDWYVRITEGNRKKIIGIIDKEEIYYKIVHQYIRFKGSTIFESYDTMLCSYINWSFPNFEKLLEKYKNGEDFTLSEI